jgi:3-hydroxyacyl-CoA dehydrogenase
VTVPAPLPRKVAVIGAGDIGCGWAALCASAGWPVTIFDTDARASERAASEIPARTRALVALGRATQGIVERGLLEHHHGRSLLQTVQGADWVIEAISEDLFAKQNLLDSIDELAPPETIISSSSGGIAPKDLFGMCRHPTRCLVIHPLNPPELVPLVEVLPASPSNLAAVAQADDYLRALGRVPVFLKKSVPGGVVGRIAAAVWRECIDLVLNGVIEVDELDQAVSLGPALGWTAAGPHLTYHLAAGPGGVRFFIQRLLQTFERSWGDLADWHQLDPDQRRFLVHAIEAAYEDNLEELRVARDRRLGVMLRALEDARSDA